MPNSTSSRQDDLILDRIKGSQPTALANWYTSIVYTNIADGRQDAQINLAMEFFCAIL
jgi:hypothetical protein